MTGSERWRQTENLYHAALEINPAGRAELLAQADPDLRREVESLLAQEGSEARIDRAAWVGGGSEPEEEPLDRSQIERGKTVGHYKMVSLIGEGGMGVVWKATDIRLDRSVAIKFAPGRSARDSGARPAPLRRSITRIFARFTTSAPATR